MDVQTLAAFGMYGLLALGMLAAILGAGVATAQSLAQGTWRTRATVVLPTTGPYRNHPRVAGIAHAYAHAPGIVRWASLVSIFFGTAFIPGGFAALVGIYYELSCGSLGMATIFGVSGTCLAAVSFVVGVRILSFHPYGFRMGRLFVTWTILHNLALLALMVAMESQRGALLPFAKAFEVFRECKAAALLTFVYGLCSLAHAVLVQCALAAHAKFESENAIEES